MSKQDIEKRLGFAAQGVKETTHTSAKAKFVREVGRKGNKSAMITKNGPDADASWLAYVVQHHGEGQGESVLGTMRSYSTEARAKAAALRGLETSGLRGGFARPNVKAKFAKPQFRTKKLHNGYIAVEVNQGNGWERYDTTHEESWNGIEEYERGYQKAYDRGLRYSGGSWRIPSTNAARPNAKKASTDFDLEEACWEGYEAVGTKKKDGKTVPNCVPKKKAARSGVKAKFGRFSTEFGFLANQIKNQPDLAKKNIIVLAKKMGKEVDITRAEFEQLMQYAAKLGMETQVANAHDDVRPGFSRSGAKGKFVRIVTTPQGRYTTNLDKNTRAPIEGGKGYVMVDPAQYITPKRVRVQGTKGEIEVRAVLDGKEIVGVSAKLVSSRPGVKAKMAKRMVVDTITSGNQKHELGYESVMQSLTAGEPPHEWFRPVVRTTNLDTGKSSEKASQPHYTEKSARDWLKNYASSVKPSTDPLYAEYASNREKISKMMTRLAQARNNPEMRQKLQAESDKLDARQREVAAQLQKRKSSRPGVKAKA